ncbi:hypothetical protein G5B40_17695 [Pikeienuella piscinae]|uniref:Uncharacterized protein n=1 Tax=Pikeienuella piscinae TaxID=2748098 RepID=A0A7L5C059_9RHOB|nr:hypothetical protein [Pikeienuella piscinae]QIE57111.1 hypothetical protein G5B40_17695 [Pikeienuella piscinae]
MPADFPRLSLAALAGAVRRGVRAALNRRWAAHDRRRYEAMTDAELAVHDLDRAGVAGRIRRRYGDLALS